MLGMLLTGLAACGENEADTAATADVAPIPAAGADPTMQPVTATPATGAATGGAIARMRNAQGQDLGQLTLTETPQGIQVSGQLRGVSPGEHGFHIHTTGQCEPSFEAAGGHWNPTDAQHGFEVPGGPHFGDMRNITVGTDSTVMAQGTTAGGTLQGTNALMDADGAAVMIHAQPDDYRSQPSGDAGDRIACGVVERAA